MANLDHQYDKLKKILDTYPERFPPLGTLWRVLEDEKINKIEYSEPVINIQCDNRSRLLRVNSNYIWGYSNMLDADRHSAPVQGAWVEERRKEGFIVAFMGYSSREGGQRSKKNPVVTNSPCDNSDCGFYGINHAGECS